MSWSDFFPVMTDDMVADFSAAVTETERTRIAEWFDCKEVFNPKNSASHVMSVSLFWQNVDTEQPDLPPPSEFTLKNALSLGMVTRFAPWEHYVEPLLRGARRLRVSRPHLVVVVWLAENLDFLIPILVDSGCEVRLMRNSSLRHSPGAMWRFLALEDKRLVTVVDADRADCSDIALNRTELLPFVEQSCWRMPSAADKDVDANGYFIYKPIVALGFGCRESIPVRLLLASFMWHSLHGKLPRCVNLPKRGLCPIFGSGWPGYGFDEWFLAVCVYPQWASLGMRTYQDYEPKGFAFPLDIEYATWMNELHTLEYPSTNDPVVARSSYNGPKKTWTLG